LILLCDGRPLQFVQSRAIIGLTAINHRKQNMNYHMSQLRLHIWHGKCWSQPIIAEGYESYGCRPPIILVLDY